MAVPREQDIKIGDKVLIPVKGLGEFTATARCVMKDSAVFLFDKSIPANIANLCYIFPDYIRLRLELPVNAVCSRTGIRPEFVLEL